MSSSKEGNAFLWTALLLLGLSLLLRIHWLTGCASALLVCWYIDYSLHPALEKRWHELLDAIRGRRQSSPEDEQDREHQEEEHKRQQEYDHQVEAAHQKSQYIHIPGQRWGDPSSYVRASTPAELERAREALDKREAGKCEREAQAAVERERKKRDDEKRDQEAREFLSREAERVLKEREEHEAAKKRECETQAAQEREQEDQATRKRWVN